MDYNAIGIKLNLYCNNYSIQTMQAKQMKSNEITSTSSLHSYLQPQLKGIQDATFH
jgi:phage terminase small subunit